MDASMTDADVSWLRSRGPFNAMDPKSFPKAIPLEGVLKYDCRLQRCEPGEIIVREGDYGNSAFLVIAGEVNVIAESLSQESLGRTPKKTTSWADALKNYLFPSAYPETRSIEQVAPATLADGKKTIREIDDRPAVFLQDFDAVLRARETVVLGPGELFGEVAAMYRSPRTATVIASSEATLLEIRWQGLRVMRRDRNFADALEQHYRTHWLPVHLKEFPLLRYLPESNLNRVIEAAELRSYGRMEWNADYKKTRQLSPAEQIEKEPLVVSEGRVPTDLVIVRSGFARMSQQHGAGHRTTAYLGAGHLFGLNEIAYNALRDESIPPRRTSHSLRAVGFLDIISIPVEVVANDILPHVRKNELPSSAAEILTQFTEKRRERRRTDRRERAGMPTEDIAHQSGTSFESTGLLEFIVQNRMNNGQQAMVIDLHRCTRCDDCVKACASVHDGNPRFSRSGVTHDRLQFVQACMHCTDPVCMIGCPTGAITRSQDTDVVSIHEPICVGCGVCAAACPYENIRMAEVFDRSGRAYCDADKGNAVRKATKCDLCEATPSGPACAAACPHDALVRIDLSESAPLSAWLKRRS